MLYGNRFCFFFRVQYVTSLGSVILSSLLNIKLILRLEASVGILFQILHKNVQYTFYDELNCIRNVCACK